MATSPTKVMSSDKAALIKAVIKAPLKASSIGAATTSMAPYRKKSSPFPFKKSNFFLSTSKRPQPSSSRCSSPPLKRKRGRPPKHSKPSLSRSALLPKKTENNLAIKTLHSKPQSKKTPLRPEGRDLPKALSTCPGFRGTSAKTSRTPPRTPPLRTPPPKTPTQRTPPQRISPQTASLSPWAAVRSPRRCQLCRNHDVESVWKGHKGCCPYTSCPCDLCTTIKAKRKEAAQVQEMTRQLRERDQHEWK